MAFEKYVGGVRSYAPKASISKSGMLSFNEGAKKRFGIGSYEYCILYYDPDTRRVGVELTRDSEAEGVKRLRHRSTGSDLAAKSFVDYYELPINKTTSYDISRDPENEAFLIVDLRSGRERGSSKAGR